MKWLLISALLGAAGATATINRSSGDKPGAVIGAHTTSGQALADNFGEPKVCRNGKYAAPGGVCP